MKLVKKGRIVNKYYLLLIMVFNSLFSMELPDAPLAGSKRSSPEEPSATQEPTEKKQKSAFIHSYQTIPKELKEYILKFLVTERGIQKEQALLNAVENIRNLSHSTNSEFRKLINDPTFSAWLIQELATRYTNGNTVEAAIALRTTGASNWLRDTIEQISEDDVEDAWDSAIKKGQSSVIKFLLDSLGQYDFDYLEALRIAIERGHNNVIAILLNNPLVLTELLHHMNSEDHAYIYRTAINSNNHSAIDQLLSHGVPVNVGTNSTNIPLMLAIKKNDLALVQKLVNAGANVNVLNETKTTPLMLAAFLGSLPLVKFLLENGADVHLKNMRGGTALNAAQHTSTPDKEEIIKLLRRHGAY